MNRSTISRGAARRGAGRRNEFLAIFGFIGDSSRDPQHFPPRGAARYGNARRSALARLASSP
jgi:hypothetical protein